VLLVAAQPTLLLAPDLSGTLVFALDGAVTALWMARLDIVGVITLGMATAIGGGITPRPADRRGHQPRSATGAT
jgi:uncharacterized membrane protein YeiH